MTTKDCGTLYLHRTDGTEITCPVRSVEITDSIRNRTILRCGMNQDEDPNMKKEEYLPSYETCECTFLISDINVILVFLLMLLISNETSK